MADNDFEAMLGFAAATIAAGQRAVVLHERCRPASYVIVVTDGIEEREFILTADELERIPE